MTRLLPLLGISAALLCSMSNAAFPGYSIQTADFTRIQGYITNGKAGTTTPQYKDYVLFAADRFSTYNYTPTTPVSVLNARKPFESDARAAYNNALMWKFTGTQAYANLAIKILDSWSGTLTAVNSSYGDRQLAASLGPFLMTNAAEIVRYTNAGWTTAGITKFKAMLLNVFYPRLTDHSGDQYEANIGNGNTKALFTYAVFLDNSTMWSEALNNYNTEDCSSVDKSISPTGQSDESGRDQGHAQLGLGNMAESSRIAENQGTDLWSALSSRLSKGFEYTAQYNLGNTVAYNTSFYRCDARIVGGPWDAISNTSRGTFKPIYENAYAHYVTEKKGTMPYTAQVIAQVATEQGYVVNSPADGAGWGTLLFRTA